jgi:AcrR family transcriptional regulator
MSATRIHRRQIREERILAATRELFDLHGMQDAPIEKIARAVGINKALIYRHFASKEELFVLTVTQYLDELAPLLAGAAEDGTPTERLRGCTLVFAEYCMEHPAFIDCALSLLRRPAPALRERVSESVWLRLGRSMAGCLRTTAAVLTDGMATGEFGITDPDFEANRLYTQTLGTMHLARIGVGVREADSDRPDVFGVDAGRVRDAAVAAALASVGPAGA